MNVLVVALHIFVALALIGVILIQRGQGADMGVSFGGGGAQTLFGSRGSGSFLGKLTGGLAAVLMLTSLTLAFFSQQKAGSVVEKSVTQQQPVKQPSLPSAGDQGGFNPSKLKKKGGGKGDNLPGAN